MGEIIKLILSNFPLVLVTLAFIFALVPRKDRSFGEVFARYILLLPVGIGGLWGFYFHAFYPEMSAEMIGWKTSPFQYEVAVANLGLGVAGVVGFWRSKDYAIGVALVVLCFLGGAAVGHIRQILDYANFAPGNAGTILFTDVMIPVLLWLGIWKWRE